MIKLNIKAVIVLILFVLCRQYSFASVSLPYQDIKEKISNTHTDEQRRYKAWLKVIKGNKNIPTMEKLNRVNDFFNLFRYESDSKLQGATDVWKTPEEFVSSGRGDCEDYAIAKYFTLLSLGVPIKQLRITYVKSTKLNRAHMVLAYYPEPDNDPYILDNLVTKILSAEQRPDLIPVYSFNSDGLWLSRPMETDRYLGTTRLSKWRGVLQRMKQEDAD